jgi:hypothetical protein
VQKVRESMGNHVRKVMGQIAIVRRDENGKQRKKNSLITFKTHEKTAH